MQIPIDMTTFTYCIFALGHILARQFPIVGFRPPVRLIDIIGRAADTRLHFYLHTFADQFDPARSPPSLSPHRSSPAFLLFYNLQDPRETAGDDDFRREERDYRRVDGVNFAWLE